MDLNRYHNCWIAIQVKPQHEFITGRILSSKGYDEFIPRYKSKRVWSDRRKEIERPLFAGYVFCKLNAEIRWPIVTTPGVIRIVTAGNEIAQIEDAEIEAIQRWTKSGLNGDPCTYLSVGQVVRVLDGPLAGTQGILQEYRNQRLVLSITIVQGSVAVEIDGCCVEPVKMDGCNFTRSNQPILPSAVIHHQPTRIPC